MTFSISTFSDFYKSYTYSETPESYILSGSRFKFHANEFINSSCLSSNALNVISNSRQVVSLLKQNNFKSSSELINSASFSLSALRHNSLEFFLSNSWYLHSLAFHNFYTGNFLQTLTLLINAIDNDIVLYRDYSLPFFIDSHIMLLGRLVCLTPFVNSLSNFQIIFDLLFAIVNNIPFSCPFGDSDTILTHSPSHSEAMLLLCRPLNAILLLSSSKLVSFSDLQPVNLFHLLSCFIQNANSLSISSDLLDFLGLHYPDNFTFPLELCHNLPLTYKLFEDAELSSLLQLSLSSPLALWLPTCFHMTNYLHSDDSTFDFPFPIIDKFIDSQPDYIICSFLKTILKTTLLSPHQ
jgi:hypothetical protein